MNIPVINNKDLPCISCAATKQMRESEYCTKTIINYDNQFIPGCMVKLLELSQAKRNFLTCQTYNLGIYSVCNNCPLDCEKNKNQSSPIFKDIVNLLGNVIGLDESKKQVINITLKNLNKPEFKEIYSSLERISLSIRKVIDGKSGSTDITRKILEVESIKLKNAFDELINKGIISKEEARLLKNDVNSSKNMQHLQSLLQTIKNQHEKKKS